MKDIITNIKLKTVLRTIIFLLSDATLTIVLKTFDTILIKSIYLVGYNPTIYTIYITIYSWI